MGFIQGCVSGCSVGLCGVAVSGGEAPAGGRETPLFRPLFVPATFPLTAPCFLLFTPCYLSSGGSSSCASLDEVGIPVKSLAVTQDITAGLLAYP